MSPRICLETGVEDLELRDGRVEVVGAPGSGLSLREVAEAVSGVPGYAMPGKFEPGLESLQSFLPSALTYGMGCHAVEVEVDVETGGVRILRYVVVNDSGRLINPMIVEGQLVGGTVHAIGNALFEWMGYDDGAQPLTTIICRLSAAHRDGSAENRGPLSRMPFAAQSARRQRRRRIRLRTCRRRDHRCGRGCAHAFRRDDRRNIRLRRAKLYALIAAARS